MAKYTSSYVLLLSFLWLWCLLWNLLMPKLWFFMRKTSPMRLGASLVSFSVQTSWWGPRIECKYMNTKLPVKPHSCSAKNLYQLEDHCRHSLHCLAYLYKAVASATISVTWAFTEIEWCLSLWHRTSLSVWTPLRPMYNLWVILASHTLAASMLGVITGMTDFSSSP